VIGSMEPEICTKILRNLNEKLGAKFLATTLGYSVVIISRLDDAFSEIFELEAGPVEGESLQQKDKKRRKRKGACPSKNVVKRDASGKKGMLSCCKCLLLRDIFRN